MVFLDSQGSQSRFADAVRVNQWIDDQPDTKAMRKLALKGGGNASSYGYLMPSLSNASNTTSQPLSSQTIESILQQNSH
jgi:D-alanyl-D-alanine endopeptidase (penicillin-binding protein 7)